MSKVGDFIKKRRLDKGWSKRALAEKAGISHSEVHRIESGEREHPSVTMILAIADALSISREEILRVAGYTENNSDIPLIEKVFPDLKTPEQQQTAQKVIDGLARGSSENVDFDYDGFVRHMDMFLSYDKKKQDSE